MISRKLWLPILTLIGAALIISGCSFGEDNVGSVAEPGGAPATAPQIPESMKTNDFGQGSQGPPQGL